MAVKEWKPGQSGNPKGRPRDDEPMRVVREASDKAIKALIAYEVFTIDAATEATQLQLMVRGVIEKAKDGDARALELILDRLVGKVPMKIDPEYGPLVEQLKYLKSLPADEVLRLASEVIEDHEGEKK